MKPTPTAALSLLILLAGSTLPVAAADNWPGFRGPSGDGHATATNLPTRWSETENIHWKTPIHDKGWSSPVVWGDQIWLTTAREDGKQLFALCLDRASGKILHDIKVFELEKPPFCHPFNSYASSTPVIEKDRLYVHYGTNGTACLDTTNGKVLWERRDLKCDHFRGAASSPILHGKLLFVAFDGVDVDYVVALDKETGKTVWKKDRGIKYPPSKDGDIQKAYATGAIFDIDGKPQLVLPAAEATIAYDPATGDELWRVITGGMNAACRPILANGLIYLTCGHPAQVLAVKTGGKGDITKSHVAWKVTRGAPTRPSPLVIGDLLFMVNDNGIATCLESKTGTQVWQDRLGGSFSGSPIYADGKLYFADEGGTVNVIEPGRKLNRLGSNKLAAGCMASPIAVGKSLLIRTKTHLYCVEQQ